MSKIDDFNQKKILVERISNQFNNWLKCDSVRRISWTNERDECLNFSFKLGWKKENGLVEYAKADDAANILAKAIFARLPELISDALLIANNELAEAQVEAKKEALSFLGDTLTIGDQARE